MFKRHGVPEKFQLITFKCEQCGREVLALVNGKCSTCASQKTSKKKTKGKSE